VALGGAALLPDPVALPGATAPLAEAMGRVLSALVASLPRGALRAPVPPPPPPLLPVVTQAPVVLQPVPRIVSGDGSVVAWQELSIGAEATGLRVAEVPAEEGDRVTQGQLLLRFDDTILAAQAAQAEAAVTEAEAALMIADADLARAHDLARNAIASRQAVEQRLAQARQAEARLAAARARREEAAARLAQARILAPAPGILTRRGVLPGAVPAPGTELFRLLREGRLEVAARVPELELGAVRPGQAVRIRHGEAEVTTGRVRAVAPTVSAESRLGLVHVALPPEATGLSPGMFARAEILTGERQAIALPAAAVVFRGGDPGAFVIGPDGRVALRRLVLGAGLGAELLEVAEGLRPGEAVVVGGAAFLSDGEAVRPVEAAAGPTSATAAR
jgi:RND family efflux transporter MFP subunit